MILVTAFYAVYMVRYIIQCCLLFYMVRLNRADKELLGKISEGFAIMERQTIAPPNTPQLPPHITVSTFRGGYLE